MIEESPTVRIPVILASPSRSNFDFGSREPIPKLPLESILTFSVPAVKNDKASSSEPAEDSALM